MPNVKVDVKADKKVLKAASLMGPSAGLPTVVESDKDGKITRIRPFYYDENHDWVSSPAFLPLTFDEQGNCTTYDVASLNRNVTIKIFPPAGSGAAVGGIIYAITLETFADPLRKYEIPTDTKKTVRSDTPSYTDATIDMLMHTACGNSRRLSGGWIQRVPYSYLFKSQLRHKRQVKKTTATDMTLAYLKKVTSTAATGTWRIIAVQFDPWNDDYLITMHRTSTT